MLVYRLVEILGAKLEAYYEDGRNDPIEVSIKGKQQEILAIYPVAERYALIKSVDVGYDWERNGMPDLDEANITILNAFRNEFLAIAKTLDPILS